MATKMLKKGMFISWIRAKLIEGFYTHTSVHVLQSMPEKDCWWEKGEWWGIAPYSAPGTVHEEGLNHALSFCFHKTGF